jgi:cyclomaltodextrinase / maltogenic alpha-amylase / neopullulanase
VMNYRFREACLEFFGKGKCLAEDFEKEIGNIYYRYPMQANFAMLNLLSSHDTARFFTVIKKDLSRMKLAAVFQFTFPGAPCVYYGEEVGMEGGRDPDNRRFMVWNGKKQVAGLFEHYRTLIGIRRKYGVFTRGDLKFIFAKGRTVGFERFTGGERALVFINNSEKPSHLELSDLMGDDEFIDVSSGKPQELKRKKVVILSPFGYLVLVKKGCK